MGTTLVTRGVRPDVLVGKLTAPQARSAEERKQRGSSSGHARHGRHIEVWRPKKAPFMSCQFIRSISGAERRRSPGAQTKRSKQHRALADRTDRFHRRDTPNRHQLCTRRGHVRYVPAQLRGVTNTEPPGNSTVTQCWATSFRMATTPPRLETCPHADARRVAG